jgi:hypothetical protein
LFSNLFDFWNNNSFLFLTFSFNNFINEFLKFLIWRIIWLSSHWFHDSGCLHDILFLNSFLWFILSFLNSNWITPNIMYLLFHFYFLLFLFLISLNIFKISFLHKLYFCFRDKLWIDLFSFESVRIKWCRFFRNIFYDYRFFECRS